MPGINNRLRYCISPLRKIQGHSWSKHILFPWYSYWGLLNHRFWNCNCLWWEYGILCPNGLNYYVIFNTLLLRYILQLCNIKIKKTSLLSQNVFITTLLSFMKFILQIYKTFVALFVNLQEDKQIKGWFITYVICATK